MYAQFRTVRQLIGNTDGGLLEQKDITWFTVLICVIGDDRRSGYSVGVTILHKDAAAF